MPDFPGTSRRLTISPCVFPAIHFLSAVRCHLFRVASPGCLWREPVYFDFNDTGKVFSRIEGPGEGVLPELLGPLNGQSPLSFSLQWRPFLHDNFSQRILLLFIFFIISYLSVPDVFRAVFVCVCCKLIPFMF